MEQKIKEVTVFTNGDSSLLSTWSNVPYFFTQTLIDKGIKVNRVDISKSNRYFVSIYNRIIHPCVRRVNKETNYEYFRSLIHYLEVRWNIFKAVWKYKDSDAYISLTFNFSAVGMTKKPVVLFCDWTYAHFFDYFLKRNPDWVEKTCIRRENKQIRKADLVLPLFPKVAEKMKTSYPKANIQYLGNVINACVEPSEEILKIKSKSKDILFIGSKYKYLNGAKQLIVACQSLIEGYPDLKLHLVGIDDSDLDSVPSFVKCYGYLDKSDPKKQALYYHLLENARVIANTTPKWGAFSSMVEAMYFYTPVITTPYEEFVETFGDNLGCGYYVENDSEISLVHSLERIFEEEGYKSKCMESHKLVKDFTWDSYIDELIKIVSVK